MNQMANDGHNQEAAQPRNVLGVLNPSKVNGSLWFKRDSITNEIRTIIRSDYPSPYISKLVNCTATRKRLMVVLI
ncbi:hypothetical protein Bca4012_043329 [Brassica carinata]|uniref:Uncharacterized protein n=1 Tax=Brassica carinata TaxID=52824 RepID=A0A8X7QVQ1_BRACI|nr:hypothetical protein Bca52824_059003 [Brassica carinata]